MKNFSGDPHAHSSLIELTEVVAQLARAHDLTMAEVIGRVRDDPPVTATDDSRWRTVAELVDRLERAGLTRAAVVAQITDEEGDLVA